MSFLDKPQKAVQCRACEIMFACDDDDIQTIFCNGKDCPGVEKPQVDKQKLRDCINKCLSSTESKVGLEITLDSTIRELKDHGAYDAFEYILKKLDAGDFDETKD